MRKSISEKQAIALLRKYAPSEEIFEKILAHSKAVQKESAAVAEKVAKYAPCDIEFIASAALLHDIGRNLCPPKTKQSICHGVVGGALLKHEGLDERYVRICERHIGIGIAKQDIIEQQLPLPKKDFIPETTEEIIIAYADNLVDGDTIRDEQYVVERFRKELGEIYAQRALLFHEKVHGLMRGKEKANLNAHPVQRIKK